MRPALGNRSPGKLTLPPLRANLVLRPRLTARLGEALHHQLTLVLAPAGYGKSTLLAAWLQTLAGREAGAIRAAWLNCEPDDNDPAQFWGALRSAVESLLGGAAPNRGSFEASAATADEVALAVARLAEVGGDKVLVLDDYHLITNPAIQATLAYLVERLPFGLHLVLAARSEPALPLARLRARGVVLELGAEDLRFAPDEVAAFLRSTMGLHLDPAEVAALAERSEGWVTGLQLVALALRHQPPGVATGPRTSLVDTRRYLLDYLVEEVIGRQPPHLQHFMLQTSILETMSGPLCDVLILGGSQAAPDPYSQLLLDQLERENLFLIRIDKDRRLYRYHHLFGEVLRERLEQSVRRELVAELHRRAAGWYAEQGWATDAVRHALASGDSALAARVAERFARRLIMEGRVQTVAGWLDRVPADVLALHPELLIARAQCRTYADAMAEAEADLRAAEQTIVQQRSPTAGRGLRGKISVLRATIARDAGDMEQALAHSRAALYALPSVEESWRLAARVICARAFLLTGEVGDGAEAELAGLTEAAMHLGHRPLHAGCVPSLALVRLLRGDLHGALAAFERNEPELADEDRRIDRLRIAGLRFQTISGAILAEWGQLGEADALLSAVVKEVAERRVLQAEFLLLAHLALARVRAAQGRYENAREILKALATYGGQRGYTVQLGRDAAATLATLAARRGELAVARSWVETAGLDPEEPDPSYPREREYLALARVLATDASTRGTAINLLRRLLTRAEAAGRVDSVIAVRVALAVARGATEAPQAAAELVQAIALGAAGGYVQLFLDERSALAPLLDEVRPLAAACGQDVLAHVGRVYAGGAEQGRGSGES